MSEKVSKVFIESDRIVFHQEAVQDGALFDRATLFLVRTADAMVPTVEVTPAGQQPLRIALTTGIDEKARSVLAAVFGAGCLNEHRVLPQSLHAAIMDHLKDRGHAYEMGEAF